MILHAATRRSVLFGLPALATFGNVTLAMAQAATESRLVVVLLRGGLDGMGMVVPYGDKDLAGLRPHLDPPPPGEPNGLLKLDGFFGLHPSLAGLHRLYEAREMLAVHAVAAPYRSRSHFDAQDFMEFGASHRLISGWLNRTAVLLPAKSGIDTGLAVGAEVPILLRGPAKVGHWAPLGWEPLSTDLYARLAAVHAHDPVTSTAIAEALKERGFTTAVLAAAEPPPKSSAFAQLSARAGELLAAPDGPRLAALEILGWDTHSLQSERLGIEFGRLDEGILALKTNLGAAWSRTVVLLMTEFGRTARANGSGGTDHGTAGVAILAGGAVAGGHVFADWPGLARPNLFEDRDLRPTLDLYGVIKGVLRDHLGLGSTGLAQVFPESEAAYPVQGLLRA